MSENISQERGNPNAPRHVPRPHYKRHRNDEYIDEISIRTVERWKESELSGDEWRFSAVVEFKRKGQVVYSRSFAKMEWAAQALPWFFLTAGESEDFQRIDDEHFCMQPGCTADAVVHYRLKKEYCRDGHGTESHRETRRKYCLKHRHRGDCALEDADDNYEQVTPDNS